MTSHLEIPASASYWYALVTRAIKLLWLVTVFLVPLVFVTPGLMDFGFDVPKVTLYRSLVGLICALWIIEIGLTGSALEAGIPKLSPSLFIRWLSAQPGRWVIVAAWMLMASYLFSTLLSPSMSASLWGREPSLDGNSFYNTLSHFLLFLAVATHIKKKEEQLWRILGSMTASGVVIGVYAVLEFYGFDPFLNHEAGGRVLSSLGNPIFAGAYLLMVAPVSLAMALKSDGGTVSLLRTICWVIPLTILVLGIASTLARGPWVGLAAALATFIVLLGIAVAWRTSLRALLMSAAAIAVTSAIVTLIPARTGIGDITSRALSAGSAVASTLDAELRDLEAPPAPLPPLPPRPAAQSTPS